MKKQIITALAVTGLAAGALAQGSININASLANGVGITTQGVNAGNPNTASTWYDGTLSLQIFWVASATAPQISAINAFVNQSGGAASALALLGTDGFTEVELTTLKGSTVGAVSGTISGGSFLFGGNIGLSSAFSPSSVGVAALVGTEVGGSHPGWSGVVAFGNQSYGGNPNATPAGTAASLTGWNTLNTNLVLSPVPEPATMALAALGGASLLLFRRRK